MEFFKKLSVLMVLLGCSVGIFAGPVKLKDRENDNPQLRYTVYTDADDSVLSVLRAAVSAKNYAVTFTDNKKILPDMDLSFTGKQIKRPEPVPFVHIEEDDSEKAAAEAEAILEKYFFTGEGPAVYPVFKCGEEGYDTYRIPSLTRTASGTLVAFVEARGIGKTDCAENKIMAKVSTDDGVTWSDPIMVADAGEASLNNPSPVYLEKENRIIVMYQYYPPASHEITTERGFEGPGVCRTFTVFSDDEGRTWSAPSDITKQVKSATMSAVACGPGIGIEVRRGAFRGRLIYPFASTGRDEGWYNYLVYSDDRGQTWQRTEAVSWYGSNESQVVELAENRFLVNARNHRYPGGAAAEPAGWNPWSTRAAMKRAEFVFGLGADGTFSCGPTIERDDLPDPRCQGFIYRYSGFEPGEKSILLFSNAANGFYLKNMNGKMMSGRVNGSIKVSFDEGKTYTGRRIYGDRFTGFQYSVMTKMPDNKVGIIFECYPEIKFAVVDLDWLTAGSFLQGGKQ